MDADPEETRKRIIRAIDDLHSLVTRGRARTHEAERTFARLVRLLRLPSADVEVVLMALRAQRGDGELASMLTTGLAVAGTDAAQGAIGRILTEGHWTDDRRHMALISLVSVEHPRVKLAAAATRIQERGGPLAPTALLMLGAVGDRIRDREPEQFAAISARVQSALAAAHGDEARALALAAVANLGPARVPAAVRDALKSGADHVRASAASSLVRVGHEEADRLLGRTARRDPSPIARRAAVDALVRRHRLGRGNPEALGTSLGGFLEEIARRDADPDLREYARKQVREG